MISFIQGGLSEGKRPEGSPPQLQKRGGTPRLLGWWFFPIIWVILLVNIGKCTILGDGGFNDVFFLLFGGNTPIILHIMGWSFFPTVRVYIPIITGLWFQICFIFIPKIGGNGIRFDVCIFFKWVKTINQLCCFMSTQQKKDAMFFNFGRIATVRVCYLQLFPIVFSGKIQQWKPWPACTSDVQGKLCLWRFWEDFHLKTIRYHQVPTVDGSEILHHLGCI